MLKKVFSVMSLGQKIATAILVLAIVATISVSVWLGWELASGRLDHADDPNYRGSVTFTEAPKRLVNDNSDTHIYVPAPAPVMHTPSAAHIYQIGLDYYDLEAFLQTEAQTLEIVVDLTTGGLYVFVFENFYGFHQFVEDPEYSGDFYVALKRSAVEEIYNDLQPDKRFVFSVVPTPINFNPVEKTLRAGLSAAANHLGIQIPSLIVDIITLFTLVVAVLYGLWGRYIYYPAFIDNYEALHYGRC